jgi:hypothetical protein
MASAMRSVRSVEACCDNSSAVLSDVRNSGSAARCSGVMPASANSGAICPDVFSLETEAAETEALAAEGLQLLQHPRGGALRGGGGIIELMREIAGEFTQRVELLRLLLHARNLPRTIEQDADDALRHGRDLGQHAWEK